MIICILWLWNGCGDIYVYRPNTLKSSLIGRPQLWNTVGTFVYVNPILRRSHLWGLSCVTLSYLCMLINYFEIHSNCQPSVVTTVPRDQYVNHLLWFPLEFWISSKMLDSSFDDNMQMKEGYPHKPCDCEIWANSIFSSLTRAIDLILHIYDSTK